jgi:outer membrane protein insertion porin family
LKSSTIASLLLSFLLPVTAAHASVADYLGKNVAEISFRNGDSDLRDPALAFIIETKVGAPLSMAEVRETIAHLVGLGRYQDVRVDAQLAPGGVLLTYNVVPVQRVRRIAFVGGLELAEDELRKTVVDRYGSSPPLSRAGQAVETLKTLYRDHGFPHSQISTRSELQPDKTDVTLVFGVVPGVRARIGSVDVQGTPLESAPRVVADLGVKPGDPYDAIELDARLDGYADDLRAHGYYEARVAQFPRYLDEDRLVSLVLSIEPGPKVEIAFEGDPLSSREREELVPIAREHSVDEDILEDSKFAIENHYRATGFCNPRADYHRNQTPSVLRIVFTVTRGPQCTLERTDLTGNSFIPSADLQALIRTRPGQPFVENTLAADIARVVALYRRQGFASVRIAPEIERAEPRGGLAMVRVRLVLAEGVRSVIQAVSFDGNSAFGADALRQTIGSAPGQSYFEPQINADVDTLVLAYVNRGYQEVSVVPQPQFSADRSSVQLRFVIHEGPQVLVDHVLIVGNVRTRTETILREVQFENGQPLSQQAEDKTRSRVSGLGIFRRVDISYLQLPGILSHRDVVITVEEAPLTAVEYGAGLELSRRLGTDAKEEFQIAPRGSFGVTRRNLFGRNGSLNLFTRASFTPPTPTATPNAAAPVEIGSYGFNEYLARLAYGERRIFNTPADGTFAGGVEQVKRTSFTYNRSSANVTLARRITPAVGLSGRYSIDHTRVFNASLKEDEKPLIDRLFPQVRLSTVSGSLIRDTRRDDALDPNRGALIGFDASLAARSIASEVGFFKTFTQGFYYRQLGRHPVVLALGGRLGLATGFARTITTNDPNGQPVTQTVNDLPASERFFAGGDTTVRGFTLDRLGRPDTIDSNGFPKGGEGLVVLNGEVRAPLWRSLGVVGFLDAGNVFLHVDQINVGQLRAAAGFGLRYRSPIGPIRVDFGVKLDRQLLPNGTLERPTALHISLGQAF